MSIDSTDRLQLVTDSGPQAQGLIPRGTVIGRYVVMGYLARGSMGEVHVGYDPELDRRLAIKLVRVGRGGADVKVRLPREAQAIAKLSHPNVVVVHDVGTFEDRIFIAMEFVDGETLNFWLQLRRRSWRDVLNVLLAAGRGLRHAHEANLVYRDFKPETVMVRDDGQGMGCIGEVSPVAVGSSETARPVYRTIGGGWTSRWSERRGMRSRKLLALCDHATPLATIASA